jgi:plasmid stabilization system protein ParE
MWTAQRWSPSQAVTDLRGLEDVFRLLREQPGVGRPRGDLASPVHAYPYRAHRVPYRFTAQSAQVVRVVAAPSNWQDQRDHQ